ncbi:hypothetical protein BGZ58_000892 [Dissophora ornata]|nr:hypothetical protein BGZ58_000892 [Dissophora ornata]
MIKVDLYSNHSQVFRDPTTSRTVPIPTRSDKAGQRIVLWKDILRVFEDAKYILNNGDSVLFLTDDDFEDILPLRISHHPGVVLDVVVASAIQATAVEPDTSSLSHPAFVLDPASETSNEALDTIPPSCVDTAAVDLVSEQIVDVIITTTEPIESSLILRSRDMATVAESYLNPYNQLHNSYFHALMSGQEFQSASIKEAMKGHFGSLQEEIDKNNALQGQLLRVQQEILEKQQQVLDRLAIMQSRIQAVLTQTYELHEYPIPRLFIVLPKHEGYDVDRPTEFFEKYGSYVLTMMQMLKYGFAAAGIVVPPLAHFKLSDGIEALQENLNLAHKSIGPLVDGTISYIESQKGDDIDGLGVTADRAELNNLEVMEGADLRQLESYLSIRDKGRVLGNLYRVVTTDGNVKWVCIDHYRENYRESVMQHLRDIVAANNGIFTEEKGKIDIKIASGTLAKQFYEAMAKARRIQELDITLQWDVTLDDLRKFAVAVGNANILHLTMDGVNFKGPPLDTINRGRRYDPILQLMSNGRI